eukprot:4127459-Prymnesium_polylepis.1
MADCSGLSSRHGLTRGCRAPSGHIKYRYYIIAAALPHDSARCPTSCTARCSARRVQLDGHREALERAVVRG